MSTTLTIRNLDKEVKRKLRIRAARNQRSIEAEARELLARGLELGAGQKAQPVGQGHPEARLNRIRAAAGLGRDKYGGKSTDEIMKELRGDG